MAKTALKNKAAGKPKFKVRAYTRCQVCGRPHSVYRKFGLCRVCLRELANKGELPGVTTLNLGTGRGYSVLEMVRAFEAASGRPVPFDIVARRPGDIAACGADPAHAERVLGGRAQRDLQAMCEDAWRWQSGNPRGYASA